MTLASVLLFGLPTGAHAPEVPPEAESFVFTPNMEPTGSSPHAPGAGGEAECEETDEAFKKTLYMFDTKDGAEAGRFVLPRPQTSAENCTIHNFNVVPSDFHRVVVMGNYQAGISVVDFTDPAGAWEIAFADPAPIETGGDWSSYWYDGAIYESDMTRGLLAWRLNDRAVAGARKLGA